MVAPAAAVKLPGPGWTTAPLKSSVPPVTLYPPVLVNTPAKNCVPVPTFITVPGPPLASAIEP